MNQQKLSSWLKAIIIIIGFCGLVVYFGILPNCGSSLQDSYPEFASWHWPWMIFLWITAVPCYAVLVLGWKVASRIGMDRSFCMENAKAQAMVTYGLSMDMDPRALLPESRNMIANAAPNAAALERPSV